MIFYVCLSKGKPVIDPNRVETITIPGREGPARSSFVEHIIGNANLSVTQQNNEMITGDGHVQYLSMHVLYKLRTDQQTCNNSVLFAQLHW